MKKVFVVITLLILANLTYGQDLKSKKGETYLPKAGDWAISFNADGIFKYLGNAFNGKLDNSAPNLTSTQEGRFVGKKFITDNQAIRIVANLSFSRVNQASFPEDDEYLTTKGNVFGLSAGLGKEWRKGKTRLQGFYGADALINLSSSKTDYVVRDFDTDEITRTLNIEQKLTYGISLNGFIGAEYFLFPKFALGAQYSYGLGLNKVGKISLTSKEANDPEERGELKGGSNFSLGNVGVSSINLTLHF